MPIVIKRKVVAKTPDPIVSPRPDPVQQAPRPVNEHTPWEKMPVASSADELFANPGRFRAPPATECKFCGHLYAFPCHGKDDRCMNAVWARQKRQAEHA